MGRSHVSARGACSERPSTGWPTSWWSARPCRTSTTRSGPSSTSPTPIVREVRRAVDRAVLRRRAPGRTAPSGVLRLRHGTAFPPCRPIGLHFSTSSAVAGRNNQRQQGAEIAYMARMAESCGSTRPRSSARPRPLHRSKQDRLLRDSQGAVPAPIGLSMTDRYAGAFRNAPGAGLCTPGVRTTRAQEESTGSLASVPTER